MKLEDALFNWLQIRLVSDARADDGAARETLAFFTEILREDHHLTQFEIANTDAAFITIRYEADGKTKTQMFDRASAEQLLGDINANPKFNE